MKDVIQYANTENPDHCIVWLYKLNNKKCPPDCPDDTFCLKPMTNRLFSSYWYHPQAVGHNPLGTTVKCLCKKAGLSGYLTNHSLRAKTATRLLENNVDEQLIMSCIGHSTTSGVCSYKRTGELSHPMS